MFNSGLVRRNGYMNSGLNTVQDRLEQAAVARAEEATTKTVKYIGDSKIPLTDEQIAKLPFELYSQGYVYYGKTHAHPNSSGRYTTSSLMDLMVYDASNNMDLINQPLLMISGSKADSFYMSKEAFEKATNAKNKELFLLEGATHIDTYWKPNFVNQAVIKLNQFYAKSL